MWTEQDKDATKNGQVPPNFRDRVSLRIKDGSFDMSKSSGNPMVTFDCEILRPTSVSVGGVEYAGLDQLKLPLRLVFTEKNKGNIRDFYAKIGVPFAVDPNNVDVSPFKGKIFDAILTAREDAPTKKDDAGKYVPIVDANGQPVKLGWTLPINLWDVLGLSNDPDAIKAAEGRP